jgi:hypothetical protein
MAGQSKVRDLIHSQYKNWVNLVKKKLLCTGRQIDPAAAGAGAAAAHAIPLGAEEKRYDQ